MFDRFYFYYARLKPQPFDPLYKPAQAITGKLFVNRGAPKVVVIFTHWHSGSGLSNKLYEVLAKRLIKKGWGVLIYKFHSQILIANEQQVVESFHHIQKQIASDLDKLTAKKYYKNIHLIGLSLGNVPLTMVADQFAGFDSATLVLAGDDLALDMWHGFTTQNIRRAFEHGHIGITKLDAEWRAEAPKNHLKHFKGKPVNLWISSTDKIVRAQYQTKLARLLTITGAKVSIKTTWLGHALTITRFCLLGRLPD